MGQFVTSALQETSYKDDAMGGACSTIGSDQKRAKMFYSNILREDLLLETEL
jgi:hypothetical protein